MTLAQNLGLGILRVINSQKILPSGLKFQAVILTRRDLSIYGPRKIWEMARKLDSHQKKTMSDFGNIKSQRPHEPRVDLGQKHGFGNVWGHKLAKVLAIRAENPSRHTNSVPLRRIWPSKNLGDGQKNRSRRNLGFGKMGYKRQAGALGPIGST